MTAGGGFDPDQIIEPPAPGPVGWLRAVLRLGGVAGVIYGMMAVLFIVRLIEWPFRRRVVSPAIVQAACRGSLAVLGMTVDIRGEPMRHHGAIVANHCSWLDIFSLNAAVRVFFVSKAEVRKWPVIGFIAAAAGTVFIERRASHARKHQSQFVTRLLAGHRLLFFPEGTSTDSRHLLPFKSTLFAAFFVPELVKKMWIQPVTMIYRAPPGEDARFYGWWGEMEFAPHFLAALAVRRNGGVTVVFHDPVRVADFADRKALRLYCESRIRTTLEAGIGAA